MSVRLAMRFIFGFKILALSKGQTNSPVSPTLSALSNNQPHVDKTQIRACSQIAGEEWDRSHRLESNHASAITPDEVKVP
jgi:hypothetical protein